MQKWFLSMVILAIVTSATAQDGAVKDLQAAAGKEVKSDLKEDGWKKGGVLNIGLNQGALSNWAAGGEQNTFGINAVLNYTINYKKGKSTWDNFFDVALGFNNATSFSKFRKTDDRIDITSKYGYSLGGPWRVGALANFNTQMFEGFNYGAVNNVKISNIFTPGKLLLSLGLDYKPNDEFSVFISPITTRLIFKSDNDFRNVKAFGVDSAATTYNEIGAFLTARWTKKFSETISFTSRLDLFSNYKRNPGNIDLFMTNLLSMKVSKNLATTISLDIVYDDDIIKKTQLKEILAIGLSMNL
jgi:hypothetical protein